MTKPILSSEYRRKPVAVRISQARRVLNTALENPRILRSLHEFGYGRTLLQEGLSLVERAEAARASNTRVGTKVFQPPAICPAPMHSAAPEVPPSTWLQEGQALLVVARKAFNRDRAARTQLELDVPFPPTPFLALQVLERLAHTILLETAFVHRLEACGWSRDRLTACARGLSSARASEYLRHLELGLLQEVASDARRTLAELDAWMSDFYRVVKVALRDSPSALALLGIRVVDRTPRPMSSIDKKS